MLSELSQLFAGQLFAGQVVKVELFQMKEAVVTKPNYHHGDLRRALLVAAVKLIEEKGLNGITLRAVAAKAGVTKTAPYRHFSNKQAMINAVVDEGFNELKAQLTAVAGQIQEPLARIKQQAITYAKFAVQHPGYYQAMFLLELPVETVTVNTPSAFQAHVDMMVDAIEEAQQAGSIKPEPALEIALSVWSMVHGLSTLVASNRLRRLDDAAFEALVSKVTDNLFYGISV